MITTLLVIFCCILVVKSETCIGSHEKSIFSGIKSSIKTLEETLEGKSTKCRQGWIEYKDHCYFFSKDKKSWQEAELRECRNIGGFLAQITDSAENWWLVNMIKSKISWQPNFYICMKPSQDITKVRQQYYWIGATDFQEGQWRWVNDLSKVLYSNWHSGQPDNSEGKEDCVHIWYDNGYKWNDRPCQSSIGYLCESPQGTSCLPYSGLLKSVVTGK